MRTAIVCMLVASVIGLGACRKTTTQNEPVPDGGGAPLAQASPLARRDALRDAYRLTPDRRMLRAVERVHAFLTGAPITEATAEHDRNGGWIIRHGGADVGRLPEVPDFADALTLLGTWAVKVERDHPLALVRVAQAMDEWPLGARAFIIAEGADKAWTAGTRTTAVLHDATRALAAIVFQGSDVMEVADDVSGQALAILAIDRALGGASAAREETLLAFALGYQNAARTSAAALPAGDSLRAFAERDNATLKTAATSAAASRETQYLWLARLAWFHDHPADLAWRRSVFAKSSADPVILRVRIAVGDIATSAVLADVLPAVTMLEVARAAGDERAAKMARSLEAKPPPEELYGVAERIFAALEMKREDLFVRFDELLPKLAAGATGPFFGTALQQSNARASFAQAIATESSYHLGMLGSLPSARRMLAGYRPSTSALSKDLLTWVGAKIAFEEARAVAPLVGHFGAKTTLGGWSRAALWESAKNHADWAEPALLDACRELAKRLDSRPSHRGWLSNIAWTSLNDMRLAEDSIASAVDAAPLANPFQQVWLAELRGEDAKLRALLGAPELDPGNAVGVVSYLAKRGAMDAATADKELARILADAGDAWSPREAAASYYEGLKRWADARAIGEEWLKRHATQPGLDPVVAQTLVARTLYNEGRYAEALKFAEPASLSWQFGAMRRAALTHEKLGNHDKALALAKAVLGRYPTASGLSFLLEVRWMKGEHAEAATDLVEAKKTVALNGRLWRWSLGKMFADVFEKAPTPDIVAAFTPLIKDNGFREISHFASELAARNRHDASFELLARIPATGGDMLASASAAYGDLKSTKGEAAALEWLKTKVPPQARQAFGDVAFRDGYDELLWSVTPDPTGPDSNSDCVWLERAAVALRSEPAGSPHRDLTLKHYQGELTRTEHYPTIGRFMVGLTDEAHVAALAIDPKSVCEVSFYMGLRAQLDGRLEDANDFYRSSVETAQMNVAELHWSFGQLDRWKGAGISLRKMKPTRDGR